MASVGIGQWPVPRPAAGQNLQGVRRTFSPGPPCVPAVCAARRARRLRSSSRKTIFRRRLWPGATSVLRPLTWFLRRASRPDSDAALADHPQMAFERCTIQHGDDTIHHAVNRITRPPA
jgi:hypothetical protein